MYVVSAAYRTMIRCCLIWFMRIWFILPDFHIQKKLIHVPEKGHELIQKSRLFLFQIFCMGYELSCEKVLSRFISPNPCRSNIWSDEHFPMKRYAAAITGENLLNFANCSRFQAHNRLLLTPLRAILADPLISETCP